MKKLFALLKNYWETLKKKRWVKQCLHWLEQIAYWLKYLLLTTPGKKMLSKHVLIYPKRSLFIVVVLLPMLLTTIYYLVFASNRYVSEASIVLRENNGNKMPSFSLGVIATGATENHDAHLLVNYLFSNTMLNHLDEQFKLKKHYQRWRVDLFSRLSFWTSQENFLDYYRKMLNAQYDPNSSLITIRLQDYQPEMAKKILTSILEESQVFTNQISNTLAEKRLAFSQEQVAKSQEKLYQRQKELLAFQNKHELVAPEQDIMSIQNVIANLQNTQATAEAELKALQTYVDSNDFQVIELENQITATKQQITEERKRLASLSTEQENLNQVTLEFERLQRMVALAAKEYETAIIAMEAASVQVAKSLNQLIIIDQPTLPDAAEYPRKLYNLTTLFIVLLMLYGIILLTVAIIREHRD